MAKLNKREDILREAERLFSTNQSVSVRKIAESAGVTVGLFQHHFKTYPRFLSEMTIRLNERQLEQLLPTRSQVCGIGDQQEAVVMFFRQLAKLDLSDENQRLRIQAARASWDWGQDIDEKVEKSYKSLQAPLKEWLNLEEDVIDALWAIYQEALRLTFNKRLESRGHGPLEGLEGFIRPKFARLLESGRVP